MMAIDPPVYSQNNNTSILWILCWLFSFCLVSQCVFVFRFFYLHHDFFWRKGKNSEFRSLTFRFILYQQQQQQPRRPLSTQWIPFYPYYNLVLCYTHLCAITEALVIEEGKSSPLFLGFLRKKIAYRLSLTENYYWKSLFRPPLPLIFW